MCTNRGCPVYDKGEDYLDHACGMSDLDVSNNK